MKIDSKTKAEPKRRFANIMFLEVQSLRIPYALFFTLRSMFGARHSGRCFFSLAITGATLLSSNVAVRLHIGVAAAIPGFMLLALLASWRVGFLAAVFVSLASTVCLDYFFTEPKFSLTIYSYQDVLALSSFLGISIFISRMVQRIRSANTNLEAKEREQSELFRLSQSILISDWKSCPEEHLCRTVQDHLGLTGIALWDDKTARYWYSGDAGDVQESLLASFRAQADYDLPGRGEHIRVLRFGTRPIGAVLFRGTNATPLFMSAIAALIASNLERVRALRAEVLAESVAVSEQLRTAVLDGLAHSVKTPLTTIAISASGLRELGGLSLLQQQFALTIEAQALSISELTNKLLRTSRLDSQDVVLRKQSCDLKSLYRSALEELPKALSVERIKAIFPDSRIDVVGDPEILRMAIVQLLENALKYSPADSPVSVAAICIDSEVQVGIHNEGTFIPPEERQLIFERYYRSPSTGHKAPGTGLGLSIAKRAIEIHQGALRVDSSMKYGTTFSLSIPKEEPC